MQQKAEDKTGTLSSTEHILKRLLINVEAFKKIEQENKLLQKELVENQELIKSRYYDDLQSIKEKEKKRQDLFKENYLSLVKRFKAFTDKLNNKIEKEHYFSEQLIKRHKQIILLNKRLFLENKKLKYILKKNDNELKNKVGSKFKEIAGHIKSREEEHNKRHTTLIESYEKDKLEIVNKYEIEKKRTTFLQNKLDLSEEEKERFLSENNELRRVLKESYEKIKTYEKNSITNKEKLEERTSAVKDAFNKKLEEITKEYLDKEIEYRAEIDSLKKDLAKYYEDLKDFKEKYRLREQRLKDSIEKMKIIFSEPKKKE